MPRSAEQSTNDSRAPSALVVIPGTVNYFYNTNGRRLAEALSALGYRVEVAAAREAKGGARDLCLLTNIAEIVHALGGPSEAVGKIRALVSGARVAAAVSLDSVMTNWFRWTVDLCAVSDVPTIFDLGLWDQRPLLESPLAVRYRFVRDGLTPTETVTMEIALGEMGLPRPIPWAFVGHVTAERAAFVDELVQTVDPGGFVYLPPLEPIAESGTPHLDPKQFDSVLRRSRYHVWCSHHGHFYMEPERFRLPLLAGCVPLKVLTGGQIAPGDAPLRDLIVPLRELPSRVRSWDRDAAYRRLCESYRRQPLALGLGGALEELGLPGTLAIERGRGGLAA
jgi:hypothetical protein